MKEGIIMKKTLITLIFVLIMFLVGCDYSTTLYTGPIEIGYSAGGGAAKEFAGWVALTISNSVLEEGLSTDILFEYGHDYNSEEYSLIEGTHSIAVFVSENASNHYRDRGEYTILFEEDLDDFVTDEYLVGGDTHNLFGEIEFHKSFELSISSSDIPYDHGTLYYVLSKTELTDQGEYVTMIVYQTISFTNSGGILVFYK